MFDTVGRYRDPEAPLRRIAAGCLLFLGIGGTLATALAVWLAVWLWPWIKALLVLLLHAIFGRAPAFLMEPLPVIAPIAVSEVDIGWAEPYQAEDPVPEVPPLPGSEPELAELSGFGALLTIADEGPEIAHLRGWNDDDAFAIRGEVLQEEMVASVGLLAALGGSEGQLDNVLSSGVEGGVWGGEVDASFGAGGLGLSGIGEGGGGAAVGIGGLGTVGTIGRGGGGGSGSGFGSRSGRMSDPAELNARRNPPKEMEVEEVVAALGYVDDGVEGATMSGLIGYRSDSGAFDDAFAVEGGVVGGVEGGVVGGVMGGSFGSYATPPEWIDRAEPDYPAEARLNGLSGRCTARIKVDKGGRGTLQTLTGCDPVFHAEVARAVQKSRFGAATEDGKPTSGTLTATFVFTL